ncbi:uncharacterized protein LOC142349430 isoform X2 [Convolutriloba macropyga]|uniref:uncharacterized protein LOC142349430 isoform X2 n=1 Tax=Convolutriloba macropyga TaxID=536237 RepID=UPI003F528F0B
MPGIDGFDHKISEYVTKNNLDSNKFQFVLIVFSQELGTDASYLVREFLDRKVFFYLIRTHIDITIMKGQKLRKSETEVLEKVKDTTRNQLSNIQTRDLSGYHRTLEDRKDYRFYMVDASDRTRFDFAGLLNDIKINLHIDSRKQMAEKVNLIWQKIVKERVDSLNKESSKIISNCAAADTVPFKSKSIKLLQFTLKMLQTFQLCRKDIEQFEEMFATKRGVLEQIVSKNFATCDKFLDYIREKACSITQLHSEAALQNIAEEIRSETKEKKSSDNDKTLSEQDKDLLSGIEVGAAGVGGAGMAGAGAFLYSGSTAATVLQSAAAATATVSTGVVVSIGALLALPVVVAGTVGGISVFRYCKSKDAYEAAVNIRMMSIVEIANRVHEKKLEICLIGCDN